MKRMILPLLAVALGIGFSAFTKMQNMDSDLVWFQLNSSGQAVDPSSGGDQGDLDPYGCSTGSVKCAAALSISEGEVVDNGDGTFGIASGVDINSPAYFNERDFHN